MLQEEILQDFRPARSDSMILHTVQCERQQIGGGGHLLSGDPAAFSQCLLAVDVDRIDANKPETDSPPS